MITTNKLLMLKAENATLLHAMQLYLEIAELEGLNRALYEFAGHCIATNTNPKLTQMVAGVKYRFTKERG